MEECSIGFCLGLRFVGPMGEYSVGIAKLHALQRALDALDNVLARKTTGIWLLPTSSCFAISKSLSVASELSTWFEQKNHQGPRKTCKMLTK